MVQLNVGRRTASEKLQVPRIVTLPRENGDNTLAPNLLDRVEDAQLIVDHYVPLCRIRALNVGKFLKHRIEEACCRHQKERRDHASWSWAQHRRLGIVSGAV